MSNPLVGIVVGSESDRPRMQAAMDELEARGIAHEFDVRSAHRQPDAVAEYGASTRPREESNVGVWKREPPGAATSTILP